MFNCNANARAAVERNPFRAATSTGFWSHSEAALSYRTIPPLSRDVKWIDAMLARKEPDNRLHRWFAGMENANRAIYAPKSRGRAAFRPVSVIDVYYSPEAPADTVLRTTSWPADWLAGYLRYFACSHRDRASPLLSFAKLITRLSIANSSID